MKCNVGRIDRVVRALVAIIIGSGSFMVATPWVHWVMLAMAVSLAVTSVVAWCPFYVPFHIATTHAPKESNA